MFSSRVFKVFFNLTLLVIITSGQTSAGAQNANHPLEKSNTHAQSVMNLEALETGGQTTRVSVSSDGTQGNSSSYGRTISADGRYVAFTSESSNLVLGDTNNRLDTFVHDRQTGATTRVSVDSNGTQGNHNSSWPAISADGRYLAFASFASNLVLGDTNNREDIFVHDRQTGTTTRVSVASDGIQGNNSSDSPAISADGRYVAFSSSASNLVSGDTNNEKDIFVHDRQTGTTTRVSVASDGTQSNNGSGSILLNLAISADGRYVAFSSSASNLVPNDVNNSLDIFVHDRQTGTTTRVSVDSNGTQGNNGSGSPAISADGRYVAFTSESSNLVPNDTSNRRDIFVHDRQTGTTTRVSVYSNGTQGNHNSSWPAISENGRYVAFSSAANNLVSDDTNNTSDVFVHDRQTGTTTRVSVDSNGTQGNDISYYPAISADGRYMMFSSQASNLVSGDTNNMGDVFVHDRQATQEPAKPPIVLVHGWQGLNFGGGGYQCSPEIPPLYNGSNSTLKPDPSHYSHLAKWLEDDGYQVWIAHLDSSPLYTAPLEKNAQCLKKQIEAVWNQNPQEITIIAHSMGGLVSRAAVRSLPSHVKVKSLFTLGSPHAGIPLKTIGRFIGVQIEPYCIIQPAVCQMSPGYTTGYNAIYSNLSNIQYNFFAGDGGTGIMNVALRATLQGPNDGLVGQYSAVGFVYPLQFPLPTNWLNGAGQYFTNETHPAQSNKNLAYYVAPNGQYSQSYACIKGLMQGNPSSCSSLEAASLQAQGFQAQSDAASYSFSETHTGHLEPDLGTSHSLFIDSGSETTFYLNWSGGVAPTFTLIRPDAVEVNEQYAINNPTEVTYEAGEGTPESAPYQAFTFPAGKVGEWQINITASSDPIDYQVFAMIESGRTLTAETDKDVYQIGENALINAMLTNGENGLTGANVSATVTSPNGVETIVPLSDHLDGTYTGAYLIPDAPGYLTIDINASGNDAGIPYTRNTLLIAAIAPNDLTLTDDYSEIPIDNDANGLYEKLDFEFGINLNEAGEYAVSAELYAGEQIVTQAGDFFELSAGSQTITLSFDGESIRQSGLNGPYTITNLYLTPIEVGITAQSAVNVLQTPAYTYTQFGEVNDTPPTIDSIVRASGSPTSAASVDFLVTFSTPVMNVDTSDFALTATGVTGASVTGVSGSDDVYTVTVNTGSGNGTIRLDVPASANITDLSGTPLANSPFTGGQAYTISKSVIPIPKAPILRSPRTNITTNDAMPTFWWSAVNGAQNYEIQFATNRTFTNDVVSEIVNGTSHSITTPFADGTYYWRVRAYNTNNQPGKWSLSRIIKIDITPPSIPNLLSPADEVTLSRSPILRWSRVAGGVSYILEVASDVGFTNPKTYTLRTNSRNLPAMPNGTYYWRVKVKDSAGNWSEWSAYREFEIDR